MKQLLPFLFFLINFSLFSQSLEHAGTYELNLGKGEHIEKTKLTLNPNGTFLFHFYDYRKNGTTKDRTNYGRGTWTSKGELIFFTADENDISDSHRLDFNNSKARFDTKSPRDKSNRDIKTSIRFYESEIFWVKGRTMIKVE